MPRFSPTDRLAQVTVALLNLAATMDDVMFTDLVAPTYCGGYLAWGVPPLLITASGRLQRRQDVHYGGTG